MKNLKRTLESLKLDANERNAIIASVESDEADRRLQASEEASRERAAHFMSLEGYDYGDYDEAIDSCFESIIDARNQHLKETDPDSYAEQKAMGLLR